ncbi:Hypothetical predicted protein [Paramuricea clavata]|uniref:Uncharacterized protein n=1 Tax=Paramuricea clavata TaxID=317549 RepID=A0A6S7GKB2_PARCT|nr:Hypothetical predicted protein [Paramuricea clavata]
MVRKPADGMIISLTVLRTVNTVRFDLSQVVPGSADDAVRGFVDADFDVWIPDDESSIKPLRGRRVPRACINRRSLRRSDFARTQRWFKQNQSRCAKNNISGEWSSTATSVPLSDQERYWKGAFEEPSVRHQRRAQPVCEANWNLVQPVTSAELSDNLNMLNDSAPGPDGMRLKDLRGIPFERFNLWLWTGYQPQRCRVGETVCISKVRGTM